MLSGEERRAGGECALNGGKCRKAKTSRLDSPCDTYTWETNGYDGARQGMTRARLPTVSSIAYMQ